MRDEDSLDDVIGPMIDLKRELEYMNRRKHETLTKFLGKGTLAFQAYHVPLYYSRLLAWAVKHLTASSGYETVTVHGCAFDEPAFFNVETGYESGESCLINGQMHLKRDGIRLVVSLVSVNEIQIEASEESGEAVKKLMQEIADFIKENNFYRNKKLCFADAISFLHVKLRDWDSVILDPETKNSIRLNTIGFLKNVSRLQQYGVPAKRGIILAGEPGTGKTIICRSLMSEADDITCITAGPYSLMKEGYISDLYELAQDLSPSMIYIEDIDYIGQERQEWYRGTPPMLALLSEMDGIEERTAIVTIATSNCFESLDKALRERPSRFDRVFHLKRPDYQRRVEILQRLAVRIPMSEEIIEYIAGKTNSFTPAQLQEAPFGMVNSQLDKSDSVTDFSEAEVDAVISNIKFKRVGRFGFKPEAD